MKRLICKKNTKVFVKGLAIVDSNVVSEEETDVPGGI